MNIINNKRNCILVSVIVFIYCTTSINYTNYAKDIDKIAIAFLLILVPLLHEKLQKYGLKEICKKINDNERIIHNVNIAYGIIYLVIPIFYGTIIGTILGIYIDPNIKYSKVSYGNLPIYTIGVIMCIFVLYRIILKPKLVITNQGIRVFAGKDLLVDDIEKIDETKAELILYKKIKRGEFFQNFS